MCVLEVLHFLPLALIALSLFGFRRYPSNALMLIIFILCISGLFAGDHAHTEHGEFFGLLDPCIAYIISLSVSSFAMAKSLRAKFATINA